VVTWNCEQQWTTILRKCTPLVHQYLAASLDTSCDVSRSVDEVRCRTYN